MSNHILSSTGAFLFCAVLAACGTSDDDGQITPDGGGSGADARGSSTDAQPEAVRMYVHTADTLYLIDNLNFALTEVGPFDSVDEARMTDLAVTPDGDIYTVSSSTNNTASGLYKINPANAKATRIADVGEVGQRPNVGMTFLIDGSLLATDKDGGVRKIDPSTGAVTELGEFGSGYATAGDLVGVQDGRMFAISDKGPQGNEDENNVLITIDPASGEFISSIGQIGWGRVYGSAVANNKIYAFTSEGYVIEINPSNGTGTERAFYENISFWGAGVTPREAIE